ncbi:hypothetical protein KY330_00775 [Candidatus Woesearchaeota archaeon]|nr:hypothetical protein [Candidatus Woesearchaeota archaeon]
MSLVDKIRKSKFCKYLAFTSCISLAAIQGCIKSEKLESKVTGPSISSMQQSSEDDVFSRLVIKNELKRFKEARLLRRLGKPYFRIGRIMQKHKKQGYALIDSEANLKAAADMILTGSPSAGIERIREILNMNKSSSENHASELAVKVAVVYHEIGEKAFNKGVSIYEDFQNLPYLSKDQAKEIIASHKLFNLILAANKCTEDIENDGGKNDLVVTSDKDLERYPPLISLELAVRKTYQEIEQQITGYEQQAKTIAKQGSYSNTQLVVILYNRVKDKKVAEAVRNKFLNVNFLTYVPVCDISIDVKQAASNLYPIIKRLQNFHKTPNICIIGHSIDGIIARTLAESPQYNDLRINKVILIATNNKGGYTEPISQLDPNFKNITIPQVLALNSNGLNPKISYFNIIGTQNTSRLRLVLTPLSRVNLNPSSKDRNDGIFDVTDAKASSVNNWNSDDLEKEYELNHFDLASDKRVIDEILLFIGINQNNLIGEYPSIEFLLNHSIEPNPSKGHYKISYPKGYRIISIRDYHCICSKTKVLQDIFLKVSDNITSHEPYH